MIIFVAVVLVLATMIALTAGANWLAHHATERTAYAILIGVLVLVLLVIILEPGNRIVPDNTPATPTATTTQEIG
ncbi:hypothetical protein [Actinomyces sp.]|uniref:hypothetical protein n=1 Tax=Actinomyces sp. TaxID=29317 RepID=UPI0026DD5F43|nr:hypothetical protein [Actinomyces sp.]MDO4899465.1 hypothetical protein [Actinomyces sp.]